MSRRIGPRFGSGFEQLECREVPAVKTFTVNVLTDTAWQVGSYGYNQHTQQNDAPVDANGNISLRAVLDYANTFPELGDPLLNNVIVNLPGGTITLDPNIGTVWLASNFRLQADSQAPATIQRSAAAAAFRLCELDGGVSVYFYSMTLQGGRAAALEGGGAILVNDEAKVQVENCTLMNNKATNGPGGAIAAYLETQVWISNSTFGLNEAADGGGAIYTEGATSLSIYGSSILGNEVTGAGKNGGGLYIWNTLSTLIDDGTSITGNEATGNGGGVYFFDNVQAACTLTMDGGQIHGNTAGGDGGGFYVDATVETVTLTDVSVTQNTAGGRGGGGYVLNGRVTGSLTTFTGNTATGGIPGIAYVRGQASVALSIPQGQQEVESVP